MAGSRQLTKTIYAHRTVSASSRTHRSFTMNGCHAAIHGSPCPRFERASNLGPPPRNGIGHKSVIDQNSVSRRPLIANAPSNANRGHCQASSNHRSSLWPTKVEFDLNPRCSINRPWLNITSFRSMVLRGFKRRIHSPNMNQRLSLEKEHSTCPPAAIRDTQCNSGQFCDRTTLD